MEGPGEGLRPGRACQPGGAAGGARVECDGWKTGWRRRGHTTQTLHAREGLLAPAGHPPAPDLPWGLLLPSVTLSWPSRSALQRDLKVILLSFPLFAPPCPARNIYQMSLVTRQLGVYTQQACLGLQQAAEWMSLLPSWR